MNAQLKAQRDLIKGAKLVKNSDDGVTFEIKYIFLKTNQFTDPTGEARNIQMPVPVHPNGKILKGSLSEYPELELELKDFIE